MKVVWNRLLMILQGFQNIMKTENYWDQYHLFK